MSYSFFVSLLLIAVAQLACTNRQKTQGPPPRYAVVRFENLSGDSSLEWAARATSESLPVALSGALDGPVMASTALARLGPTLGSRPAGAPGISAERTQALLAGANRIIAGYLQRVPAGIRIAATVEDPSTGKSIRTVNVEAPSPEAAIDRLAREFSPRAKPGLTANPEALHTYASAIEAPAADRQTLFAKAVELDPGFGSAWVALARVDAAHDRAAAEDTIARALKSKLDSLSLAELGLEDAELKQDRNARLLALRKLASLSPGDTVLLRSLAETETAAGEFAASAADWKKLSAAIPADAALHNNVGYALAYAGDYAGALAAFRTYESMAPKDANPSDSMGDLYYWFGKFPEAAASYLEADRKQPGFEQFGDLYKAAWARFQAGDRKGADELFDRFMRAREKSSPAAVALQHADWLYRTGRRTDAVAHLQKLISAPESPAIRMDAVAQLIVWDLVQGDREQAAKEAASLGPTNSSPPVFMARFAALPSASTAEWEARADRMVPPQFLSLRLMALGYALMFDGKREAAIPVWQKIVASAAGTDFYSRAVYAHLQGKKPERPLLPDPINLNQFLAVLDMK